MGWPGARRNGSEADVPAECTPPVSAARVPEADEQSRRTGCSESQATARSSEVVSLIGRIRSGTTFERLRRDGRVVRHGLLEIRYLLDGGGDPPRVAFAVSAGTGSAVARNRLRRRLRAVMRELADPARRPAFPSGDYLLRPRRNAGSAEFARRRRDAERLLARIVEDEDSS
ncbi:MAG: hypothetical protein F4121_00205 [Acidimicrobiia bacterium]|nr:hypothetical protein [Acidimicrobiia bacterium]